MRAFNHISPTPRPLALAVAVFLTVSPAAVAAPTNIANAPLANAAATIKPNLMFVLDNSGSMENEYMPDFVGEDDTYCRDIGIDSFGGLETNVGLEVCQRGDPPYMSPHFNAQYYNPAITYLPPVRFDGSSYPSYDNSAADRQWTAVRSAPFDSKSTATRNLLTRYPDTAWCTSLRGDPTIKAQCRRNIAAHAPTTPADFAANAALGEYLYPNANYDLDAARFGARVAVEGGPYFYTIDPISIAGTPIDPDTGAAARVVYCKARVANNASELNRYGDVGTDIAANCSLKRLSPFVFARFGKFKRVDIKDGASYPKAASRSDCSGATGPTGCTYKEEMTNFANWFAYYRTRMNMMKTAAGRAFARVDDKFRVGWITIRPGKPVTSDHFLKPSDFTAGVGGQKDSFFSKFYAMKGTSFTPLREALARVGRYYAGKGDGINSGMGATDASGNLLPADDPVLASCQQNFTILSTDGYWNTDDETVGPVKIDGTTRVGNQDGSAERPQKDALGASDALADVAQYYYMTDLRPAKIVGKEDIWDNNVRGNAPDNVAWQHMTTFTLGLGLDGTLRYRSDYGAPSDKISDFGQIVDGTINWPKPVANNATALDDLWHAAVNGRGRFFSAKNPAELSSGLARTLENIQALGGAGAAAATSNLLPVEGDNFVFTAEYKTKVWSGDLKAYTLDLNEGVVSSRALWSAAELLDKRSFRDRDIRTFTADPAIGDKWKPFLADKLAPEIASFGNAQLSQFSGWTADQKGKATSETLINYIRGDRTYEDTGKVNATDLYRPRESVMGDAVNAQPIYVRNPLFAYRENRYDEFAKANENRTGVIYVAANDGMLHAFAADPDGKPYFQTKGITTAETSDDDFDGTNDGGKEIWAYVPGVVLPGLYRLADTGYNHAYFVDGTPITGDVYDSARGRWRTIMVGGLNGGGRGYYAIDITDPVNGMKVLWEFKVRDPALKPCATTSGAALGATDDCDLGYTFGNPSIVKWRDKWVVIVTSGYNNFNPGDGNGHLFILDALSGEIVAKASLPVSVGASGGTAAANFADANPVGLGRTAVWIEEPLFDAAASRVYAGDLKGNLWRFDLTGGSLAPFRLATLVDPTGNAQPITTRPELALIENQSVVLVGTGKYIGTDDPIDVQQQTIYAIRDAYPDNITVTPRSSSMIQRKFGPEFVARLDGRDSRPIVCGSETALFSDTRFGWYVDFPADAGGAGTGERVNVDPLLLGGTLIIPSNIPSTNTCSAGGSGWLNFINHSTGCAVATAPQLRASVKFSGALVVGVNVVKLPGGKFKTIVTTADNKRYTLGTDFEGPPAQGRRASWRELMQ